jgi:Phage tail lysozyme
VTAVAVHNRKPKIRRTGRHAAPSQMNKVAGTAAKAAPAVVAIGALAAVPQIHDILSSSPAASAGHGTTTAAISPIQPGSQEVMNVPQTFRISKYVPKHLQTSIAGRSARVHRAHHSVVHHSVARDTDSASSSDSSSSASSSSSSSSSASSSSSSSSTSNSGAAAGGKAPACSGSGSPYLPDNYATIVAFLVANGYSGNAAAGIAGNIFQESKGNPESVGSGGGGLIGWTPLPAGFVTGNPAADLQTQLKQLLVYNEGWHQFVPALNAASSPAQAAEIYMLDFERPLSDVATIRVASAEAVAAACGI